MGVKMKLRAPYENKKKKRYSDFKEYYVGELSFSSQQDAKKKLERYQTEACGKSRVWLLFASNDSENWECLQVAQSKNKVVDEIKDVIKYLYSKSDIDFASLDYKNSLFYEDVRPIPTSGFKYREILYSLIGKKYKDFKICFLDVDKYLKITSSNSNETDAERIIEICKNLYAEAKIAYETLAVYWMQYKSGVDGQTISYIGEHEEEFQ